MAFEPYEGDIEPLTVWAIRTADGEVHSEYLVRLIAPLPRESKFYKSYAKDGGAWLYERVRHGKHPGVEVMNEIGLMPDRNLRMLYRPYDLAKEAASA